MKNTDIDEWLLNNNIDPNTEIIADEKQWFLSDILEKHLKEQFAIHNVRLSLPPDGFDILKYRIPKDGRMCDCITEIGRTFTAKYLKFKSFEGGVFVNDELDEGYRDKVIYWKGNEA